ncbi:hypothetical protein M422DRAFT_261050 [Sphaerobolus stellatus SS14]|uniref:C2H2-type domain-containing protein n=1 Tax=Sphaerobolus stellatus (strain SS14) TaxID=990650 RepID=A0A0C9U159_SPHS4|nr:hypothetical protein M422DRAFT_261050 [Sphaerobolus stellatus SS14]
MVTPANISSVNVMETVQPIQVQTDESIAPPSAQVSSYLVSRLILKHYAPHILMPYKGIVCLICQNALAPSGLPDHLQEKHTLSILSEDTLDLKALWNEFEVVRDMKNVPRIPGRQPPLPGIHIIKGLFCQHCEQSVQKTGSMRKHWYVDHAHDKTPFSEDYVYCRINMQLLLSSARRYFEVMLPFAFPQRDPWEMYLEQHDSKISTELTVYLTPMLSEVPPLQKDTGWHLFFTDVIISPRKMDEYLVWIVLPPHNVLDGWETHLKGKIVDYVRE